MTAKKFSPQRNMLYRCFREVGYMVVVVIGLLFTGFGEAKEKISVVSIFGYVRDDFRGF